MSSPRFYSEGLGVSREAARLNARRAILGVIPGPETAATEHEGTSSAAQKLRAAVTHAHDDALTHSLARKILQVRAAEEAEAATSEDGPRERKLIEVRLPAGTEQLIRALFHDVCVLICHRCLQSSSCVSNNSCIRAFTESLRSS